MKIINLKAENFKKLEAIQIKPSSDIIEITGKNDQGKSSVLDAIWWVLQNPGKTGKNGIPQPIRKGESQATVVLDLGDLIAQRICTNSINKIELISKEGAIYPSPQAMLDNLLGQALDPMEFKNLNEKEQHDILLDAIGLKEEFERLEHKRKEVFDERTIVNRELKKAQASLPQIPPDEIIPVNLSDLISQLDKLQNQQKLYEEVQRQLETQKNLLQEIEAKMNELLRQKKVTEQNISKLEDKLSNLEYPNTSEIKTQINQASEINRKADEYDKFITSKKVIQQLTKEADQLSAEIAGIDLRKQELIESANLPLPGLMLQGGQLLYNDIPFKSNQLSDSEITKICIAIAAATIPQNGIRVMRIKNGSLLDSHNKQILAEMAQQLNFQAWIETVDESGKIGIVIEEGKIKKDNYQTSIKKSIKQEDLLND